MTNKIIVLVLVMVLVNSTGNSHSNCNMGLADLGKHTVPGFLEPTLPTTLYLQMKSNPYIPVTQNLSCRSDPLRQVLKLKPPIATAQQMSKPGLERSKPQGISYLFGSNPLRTSPSQRWLAKARIAGLACAGARDLRLIPGRNVSMR